MPCFSSVTKTQMTDAQRLGEALGALGIEVLQAGAKAVVAVGIDFSRSKEGEGFSTTTSAIDKLQAIQRKYAELGVRAWAKRKGFSVAESDGRNMTLINRRK